MHGTVLESRPLAGGTDLKRTLLTAMVQYIDEGWLVKEFSSASASFFCDRHPERRMISIDPTDPYDVPMYGGSHLNGCPNCGD